MKKNYLLFAIAFLFLMTTGCNKKQKNTYDADVTATIGTIAFHSTGKNVDVGESPAVVGSAMGGTEDVTITGSDNTVTESYLVVEFGYTANDVKSYSVDTKQAICAYHKSGAVSDDVALTGSVTITKNIPVEITVGKHLEGNYDFTTQAGIHVTGTFSVQVNY